MSRIAVILLILAVGIAAVCLVAGIESKKRHDSEEKFREKCNGYFTDDDSD